MFPAKAALQQRVLPNYRAPLFDLLAQACTEGLEVFAGSPRPAESIETTTTLHVARLTRTQNVHLLGGPLYLCWQRGILQWLQRTNPAALIVEANPRYLSTPGALRWMQARRLPIVGWGLGAPRRGGVLRLLRMGGRAAFLRRFDALIAYSTRGAKEFASFGFPAERIVVAYNAALPRPVSPAPPRPPLEQRQPVVLFVGRLQTRKRIDLLLQACANLPAQVQPRLVIVGDGPARPSLQQLAAQIYPAAQFPGAMYGTALESFYRQADLFALPGTGGLAIQQAMAYALPVIAAEGDGTQEDLVRPANGWLIRPGSVESLTEALLQALQASSALAHMGAESYRIVRDEINLQAMVESFLSALQIAAEHAARRS